MITVMKKSGYFDWGVCSCGQNVSLGYVTPEGWALTLSQMPSCPVRDALGAVSYTEAQLVQIEPQQMCDFLCQCTEEVTELSTHDSDTSVEEITKEQILQECEKRLHDYKKSHACAGLGAWARNVHTGRRGVFWSGSPYHDGVLVKKQGKFYLLCWNK